jgi:DNA-binding XRE family transcriptional regulator
MDEETVKRLQAEAVRKLQDDFARIEAAEKVDPVKTERRAFAFELERARSKKRISQSELARRAGVYQADISRIECAKANPSLNTLLKIAKALDADLSLD